MINLKIMLSAVSVGCLIAFSASAGVTFLPGSSYGSAGGSNSSNKQPQQTDTAMQCKHSGYYYTSCPAGSVLKERCPYNNSYYKECCDEEYKYSKNECINAGLSYSRKSCGGLYKCL